MKTRLAINTDDDLLKLLFLFELACFDGAGLNLSC